MLPDFLPAAEVLAKGVKHVACYVADAITERRKAFDDDEAGDYLRCAGADALAEALCVAEPERDVWEPEVCYFCTQPTGRVALFGGPSVCEECVAFIPPQPNSFVQMATTSPAADPPTAASDDPAATEDTPTSPVAAGSPPSDSKLFTQAADLLAVWMPDRLTSATWPREFIADLRDRAAQFAAVEASAKTPFHLDDCDICNPQ